MTNLVVECGRLTKDPDIRYTDTGMCIAKYTLAVEKRTNREECDFIPCVAFGKSGEFVEKYLEKGKKIIVTGKLQSGSYERDGQRIFSLNVVAEQHEFADNKGVDRLQTVEDNKYGQVVANNPFEDLAFN